MKRILLISLLLISNFCIAQSNEFKKLEFGKNTGPAKAAKVTPDDYDPAEEQAYRAKIKAENDERNAKLRTDYLAKKELSDEKYRVQLEKEEAELEEWESNQKTIVLRAPGYEQNDDEPIEYHLTPEQIRQGREMMNYQNAVQKYESNGLSSSQANDFAQRDANMKVQEGIINTVFEGAGNMIIDGMNRKEERENVQNEAVNNFREGVEQAAKAIGKSNREYKDHVNAKMKESYAENTDITALKNRALLYIDAFRDYTYSYRIQGITYHREQILIVQQSINKAYFKGNVLHLDYNQKVKMAQYDKDHNRPYKDVAWQPAKYNVHTIVEYNTATRKGKILQRGVWGGNKVLPSSGYLPSDEFWEQTNKLSKRDYAIPFKSNNDIGLSYVSYELRKILNNLSSKIGKEQRIKLLNNEEFMESYGYKLASEVEMYKSINSSRGPKILTKIGYNSSNRNEVSILCVLENKYIIFSFPNKEKIENLNQKSSTSLKEDLTYSDVKIQAKINGYEQSFRQSKHNKTMHIGGVTGKDLLISGQKETQFVELVFSYYNKNKLEKDINTYNEYNRDIWNPTVEIGKIEKRVDNEFVKDKTLLKYLEDQGFTNLKTYYPNGLYYNLIPEKVALLLPTEKITYSYQEKVKGKYLSEGKNTSSEFLYFTPVSIGTGNGIRTYRKKGKEEILKNVLSYKALDDLMSTVYFNDSFYEHIYKYISERPETKTSAYINKNGTTLDMIHSMIGNLLEISYSEFALNNDGRIKYFDTNGKLKSIGKFIDGNKFGYWEYFYENGNLKKSCNYRHGKIAFGEEEKTFDESGRITTHKNRVYADDKSYSYEYGDDGSKREFTHNAQGIKHGPMNFYDSEGILRVIRMYEEGLLLKNATFYYENGVIMAKGQYINGKLNGHVKYYYPNGRLQEEGEYMNGKKQESWKVYDENGKFLRTEEYINDKKQ